MDDGQVFTFRRFTKAHVHTFLHLDRFQGAFSSSSLPSSEKKGEGCRRAVAFSSRIHVDARSDANTLPGYVPTLLPVSLEPGKKEKRKDFPFFLDVQYTPVPAFEVVAFFSTCSWRTRKSWPGRLAHRDFSFFRVIFGPDTFLLESRLRAQNESHLRLFLLLPGYSVNLRPD